MVASGAVNRVGIQEKSKKNAVVGKAADREHDRVRANAALRLTSAVLWMSVCSVVFGVDFAEAQSSRERMRGERSAPSERVRERQNVSPLEAHKTRRTVGRDVVSEPTQIRDGERLEDRRPAWEGRSRPERKEVRERADWPRSSGEVRTLEEEARPERAGEEPRPTRQNVRERMPNDVQRAVIKRSDPQEYTDRQEAADRRDRDADREENYGRHERDRRDREDRRDAGRSRDHDDRRPRIGDSGRGDYGSHDESRYGLYGFDRHERRSWEHHDRPPAVHLHRRHVHRHDASCRHSRVVLVPTFFPLFSAFYDPFDEFYCWHCDRYFMSFSSFGHHLRWVHGLRGSEVNFFLNSGVWVYY